MSMPHHGPGGYELEGALARTEHCTVLAGNQRSNGRRVAIKMAIDDAGARALRNEIAVVCSIRHPHLLAALDATTGDEPMLVTERACCSLAELMASHGPLADDVVAGVVLAIATGLAELHRRRLVHGDVKPANILFENGGRPVLADFGATHQFGAAATASTAAYFVTPTSAGDIASLARAGLAAAAGSRLRATSTVPVPVVPVVPVARSVLGARVGPGARVSRIAGVARIGRVA